MDGALQTGLIFFPNSNRIIYFQVFSPGDLPPRLNLELTLRFTAYVRWEIYREVIISHPKRNFKEDEK